ncbi:ABC transporter ATP-binding protein [Pseudomonas petrae]|uniref:ABC transporter ATP-binding protein n=1 Tax=Pseudomonas petrae TaxID=2912190 RepID=UPI001F447FA4|nr:ABC transporter ATP-binding protein [Pseudomonas petrae]MCF7554587.1 ABC transporter ATP-binding protein [Pseudomonas petrae]
MSVLELDSISKRFGAVHAVENISLSVPSGSRVAIVGASGSGKSTLLRMIAGFEFPDAGRILLDGATLVDNTAEVPAHRRLIGYVPQDGALFPHLSVASNIGFGLQGGASFKRQRVLELMKMVALDGSMYERWPHELSGGQQQRVALARALAQRPKLMLLDEPFSALDTGLRTIMRRTVTQLLGEAGITAILVTHDQAEALSFANQLAIMRHGKLIQVGPPEDLYRFPKDEETAHFLGDAIVLPAQLSSGWAVSALGRVAVSNRHLSGAARILLRPEQVHIESAEHKQSDLPRGQIIEMDYSGGSSTLTVKMDPAVWGMDGASQAMTVSIRSFQNTVPRVGSTVHVKIDGRAHVLSAVAED